MLSNITTESSTMRVNAGGKRTLSGGVGGGGGACDQWKSLDLMSI